MGEPQIRYRAGTDSPGNLERKKIMALELKIKEEKHKPILWNKDEIATFVNTKVADYKGLVYTDEQIPEAKKDLATLRKFRTALEDKRKEIKKSCLEPYEKFEKEEKEILAILDEPIGLIDSQIKEYDEKVYKDKCEEIKRVFAEASLPPFVSLKMVWNPKWANKTFSIKAIAEEIAQVKTRIETEIATINQIPDFAFECLEVYKQTLNISQAIEKGKQMAEIQKRKEEAARAEEQRRKEEEAARASEQAVEPSFEQMMDQANENTDAAPAEKPAEKEVVEEPRQWIAFKANLTISEARELATWLKDRGIEYGRA